MHDLAVEGKVALAGRFADGSGGLFPYRADSERELAELVDNDPYIAEGAVAHRTLRPFEPVIAIGIDQEAPALGGD